MSNRVNAVKLSRMLLAFIKPSKVERLLELDRALDALFLEDPDLVLQAVSSNALKYLEAKRLLDNEDPRASFVSTYSTPRRDLVLGVGCVKGVSGDE